MPMAEVMIGFKTDQCNPLVLLRQVNQLLDFGFVIWQEFVFVCLEQGFVGNPAQERRGFAFAKSLAHGGWDSKFGNMDILHPFDAAQGKPCAFDILLETLLGKSIFHGLRVIANIHNNGYVIGNEFVQEGVNGQAFVADGKYGGLGVRILCELKLVDLVCGEMSARDFAPRRVLGKLTINFLDEFVPA
jgi:hypothetical protein